MLVEPPLGRDDVEKGQLVLDLTFQRFCKEKEKHYKEKEDKPTIRERERIEGSNNGGSRRT